MQTPDRHLGNAKVIATVAYVFGDAESSQSERLKGSVLPNMTTPKGHLNGFSVDLTSYRSGCANRLSSPVILPVHNSERCGVARCPGGKLGLAVIAKKRKIA